jgi:hypothetical protein
MVTAGCSKRLESVSEHEGHYDVREISRIGVIGAGGYDEPEFYRWGWGVFKLPA